MYQLLRGPLAVLALFATFIPTSNLLAGEVSFKTVTMLPAKHPIGKSFNGFITRLNTALKGEFKLDWRGGPEVVPQFKQPNAVRLGSVDACLTSPSYANGIVKVSGSANYSNKQYNEVKASGYHDYMAKVHAAKGLIFVGDLPVSQLKFHIFLKKPIKTIDGLKNMKIRVFPAIAPAIKALGGNPVVLPMPQIYTSMERGLVSGFVTGVSGVAKKYKEVIGAYITPGFYRATFHFLVNPKSWAKLPDSTKAKIINFVRNVDPPTYEAGWSPVLKRGYADLKKGGVKAIKFSPKVEAKFKKTVLGAAWSAVKKKAPKEGKILEKMLLK